MSGRADKSDVLDRAASCRRVGSPGDPPAQRARRVGAPPAWLRRLPLLPALIYMIVVTQAPFV